MQGLRCSSEQAATMRVVAPSGGYAAEEITKVEDVVGVIVQAADAGDDAVLMYQAQKIVLPKSTTTQQNVLAAGQMVYFDAGEGAVCSESSGNSLCGMALEAAGASDDTALCHLNGMLG